MRFYNFCMRLDIFIQKKFDIKSRSQAQVLIRENKVFVNKKLATKCGLLVNEDDDVELKNSAMYVSRAGEKLEGAFSDFNLDAKGLTFLDIGASTGGFCDFLLSRGAKKVYALDVGTNQLDEKIKNDSRVVDMSNTDIRQLDLKRVQDIDAFVCDVSFISLTKISDIFQKLLDFAKFGVVLIKPQFECGKVLAKKYSGVIKDEKIHKIVIDSVISDFKTKNITAKKLAKSKIAGKDGNVEFLVFIEKSRQ